MLDWAAFCDTKILILYVRFCCLGVAGLSLAAFLFSLRCLYFVRWW